MLGHLGRERNAINYPIKQNIQFLLDSGSCHIVWCFQKHASIHITVNCLLHSGITAEKHLKYYLRYSDMAFIRVQKLVRDTEGISSNEDNRTLFANDAQEVY